MNNLSKRPNRTKAVSIVPSDKRIQEKQAGLLSRLRDLVRSLQNGIAERDAMIEERDKRIAELEAERHFHTKDHQKEEYLIAMRHTKQVSNRIREERKNKNMNIDDLAKLIGVSRATINNYETGTHYPKLITWKALANIFGVDIEYLMGYEE
ncbi:helix-turn-helix transcriptional regulator [Weissella koreensis]|uniref:helix-turn-helix transcriptional regulator n=1 Tax=Weissella koreensis TaxID=165096 RepID=UPI0022BA6CB3|nr:helix-turn-helix transcriptional regulator [Weissella koreensis]MCZ9310632.1 helix-turn-helix transcriptional regulator [Weissella koreensis]